MRNRIEERNLWARGNDFRLHKHVKLITDPCWIVAGQQFKIVHHMHLIMVSQSVRDVSPSRFGRRTFLPNSCFEPSDPCIKLGRDSDFVSKPTLELANAQPHVMS